MQTYLSLPYAHETDLPPGHDDEVRTPDALVERFLREHTGPGDRVFDPFAGYGTTLRVAEQLGREPYGLEYEPELVDYVNDQLEADGRVRHGDVLDVDPATFPDCDYCFTSPPFMVKGLERNPFENYAGQTTYADYLDDAERAFATVAAVLGPGGRLVVDVANVRHEGEVTPLAFDLTDRLSNVFHFDGEVVVTWEEGEVRPESDGRDGNFGYGVDHTYCLVFSVAE